MNTARRRPKIPASVFLGELRSGGLFTRHINQRLAAVFASTGYRLGLHPTALTLLGFVISCAASLFVMLIASSLPDSGVGWRVIVAMSAFVGWQVAYSLDCADGQLARVTGSATPEGAKIDVLCDIFVHALFATTLAVVVAVYHPDVPVALLAAFAAGWMVTLTISVLDKTGEDVSLVASSSLPIQLAKSVRDFGAILCLAVAVLIVWPVAMLWLVAFFTILNGSYLMVLIVRTARRSVRVSQ